MSSGVISIDDGGSSTCVVTRNGQENFPSVKGLYGQRTLTDVNSKYDFVVDYKGEKYALGTLAKYDCKYPLQMHSDSKRHIFYDLSILTAIHQYGYLTNYLITSVPISMHNEDEKEGRILRLKGKHTIKVNGITKTFEIEDAKVAPESASAFWINEPEGKSRYIDLGSRMIGYATTVFENEVTRFIDSESGTFKGKGLEALDNSYDQQSLADYICGRLLAIWNPEDNVSLLGGGALDDKLVDAIVKYFPNTVVLDNPQMSNALGMYMLGRIVYGVA